MELMPRRPSPVGSAGRRLRLGLGLVLALAPGAARAAFPDPKQEGPECVVVYNARLPESLALATYYADRRGVPSNQVVGLDLPVEDTMTRGEFRDRLQRPLWQALRQQGLLTVSGEPAPATGVAKPSVPVTAARVRYVTLCYGVPVRIVRDAGLTEPGQGQLPEQLRRNEAAVDSELALLPMGPGSLPAVGLVANPLFGRTNAAELHPTNGLLLVARLDGPSPEIARGLVDKALAAETNGLWGRAYFDWRGVTNQGLVPGDNWIRGAAELVRRAGFETITDDRPETFAPAFPMSDIAFYAGWYDAGVSGPFARPQVEFVPGAVAYHIHSFSGAAVRAPDRHWVGPLLAKGVTATMGCVDEPYLEFTPNLTTFWATLVGLGYSFGEAAYAAQPVLSWQVTVVGDPLYRPFGRFAPGDHIGTRFTALHEALLAAQSPLLPWSLLQAVNFRLALGQPPGPILAELERDPVAARSAVLQEKRADLAFGLGRLSDAIGAYRRALTLPASPQQRVRLTLGLAQLLALYTRDKEALALYQQFLKEVPDYPAPLDIHRRMLPLARRLNLAADAARIQAEIDRLTPPPAKP